MFDWLKKRFARQPAPEPNPLAPWDERLGVLTRRTSELRRSAATLLSLRGELERGVLKARQQASEARRKAEEPAAQRIAVVLAEDAERADKRADELQAELERVRIEADGLAETVRTLEAEAEQLRRERSA
ncbi:MAG: hypothetical protein ACK4N5_24020, partial [Myxococcales bacterium]